MSRTLRSPVWIAGHVLALVAVVAFSALGLWQLDRHEQREARTALLEARAQQEVVSLPALLGSTSDPAVLAYRRVRVRGRYVPEDEVLLSTRSHAGRTGHHVLTPLETADGVTVLVDRGWVPLEWQEVPVAAAPPPQGEVEVEGVLVPGVRARRTGRFDGAEGPISFVSQPDPDAVGHARGRTLLPVYLLAREHEPPAARDLPVPAALPAPSQVDHLSYAVQWFLFAGVVTVGYPVLLWRRFGTSEQWKAAGSRQRPSVGSGSGA